MFHINAIKLLKEEKENGAANVSYYSGQCLTCENSPDREMRAACPKADFFAITAFISKLGNVKTTKHLCKHWVLCSEIINNFKKNQGSEVTEHPGPPKPTKTRFHK
jgi:hypothetical protein